MKLAPVLVAVALAALAPVASAQTLVDTSPAAIAEIQPNLGMDHARVDVVQRDGTYAVVYIARAPISIFQGVSARLASRILMLVSAYHGGRDFPDQLGQRILFASSYRMSPTVFFVVRNSTVIYNPAYHQISHPEDGVQAGMITAIVLFENSALWGRLGIFRANGVHATYEFIRQAWTNSSGQVRQPLTEDEFDLIVNALTSNPAFVVIDHTDHVGMQWRVFFGGGFFGSILETH
jgi:hypothetical protein